MKKALLIFSVAVIFSLSAPASGFKEFKENANVCFIGDSITHGGLYPMYVMEYYATRFPEKKISFLNKGISGDTANGGVKRFDWDVLATEPDYATIMFGMNDVGRGLYDKGKADKKTIGLRKKRLELHKKKMNELVALLKKNNVEVILITPSIFDQTGDLPSKNSFGVNEALGECAAFCREKAEKEKLGLVDFHAPMTKINSEVQKKDKTKTIVGRDRVHPGKPGHLIMAYFFLKEQGVPSTVASASIDFKTREATGNNCVITDLRTDKNSISFNYLAQALPFPGADPYNKVDKLVPFTKELNQETIKVKNLPEGKYILLIDGKEVTGTDSAELAKGLNISILPTPQQKQALKLHTLLNEKRNLERKLRNLAKIDFMLKRAEIEPGNIKAADKYLVKFMEKIKHGKYSKYYKKLLAGYRKNRPRRKEIADELGETCKKIYSENTPEIHKVEIKKLK